MKVAVFSGAGLSKASGIPTYRDEDGLWNRFETAKFSETASMLNDPVGFQSFWADRMNEISKAVPNAAHKAFAELEAKYSVVHVTQNIDGLLTKAGCTCVHELHGNLSRWRVDNGVLRPDVIMFGEQLPIETFVAAREAVTACDYLIIVGTTGVVYPAASLVKLGALSARMTFIVNVAPTEVDYLGVTLRGPAEVKVPQLVTSLLKLT